MRAERSNLVSTTVDLGRFAALAMTVMVMVMLMVMVMVMVMVMKNGERTMAVQPGQSGKTTP